MFPDLYLMRHGQTVWNTETRLQGRLDSELTELGRSQARDLAGLVGPIHATRFSSPQGRAVATARLAFNGKGFRRDARLAEIDTGDFTGQRLDDLASEYPEIFDGDQLDWYDKTPNGEHFDQLRDRCLSFLHDLDGPALIVTHGVTLRMLALLALGLPLDQIGRLPVEQGVVLAIRDGAHKLMRKSSHQVATGLDSPDRFG